MSRVGKVPITIPTGISLKIDGSYIKASGPKGELEFSFPKLVQFHHEGNSLTVSTNSEDKFGRAMWGTARNVVNNMVRGVSVGFSKKLELVGTGYKAAIRGKILVLELRFSHPVFYGIPSSVSIETPTPTEIVISGIDKQVVGEIASEIRKLRPPEPYQGKGVRYAGERIIMKEGKKK
ncbi:50S ribosomal protein L6 [Candidatus Fokinia solitaria]|uniref:Large ribosomal subunit protein uL6 n=1 Tax=Candidatus Fokinia solitaria TaxID=1802984 RepID=A0A2U8BRM5_9RICK|nr:50S ribosomal protein L6 [Candidatus Fokinia solitaria]AWD32920.1 50S ribosomal protein L6 [Candidatus Fokinia solitaria]